VANLRVCHALLLLGVVVGRLNKHTTPQKERVKKGTLCATAKSTK